MAKLDQNSDRVRTDQLDKISAAGPFWTIGALLVVLLVAVMARDINRPYYGLHSWGEAHGAWQGRAHVNYGLNYTKGLVVWAVGNPPTENPKVYLDHPQLPSLFNAAVMKVLGVNEVSLRICKIILAVLSLLLLLRISQYLIGPPVALLAGLFYVLFPLTGYFGVGAWVGPTALVAIWCYLVLIAALPGGPKAKKRHWWGLAVTLFLMLQFSWTGFFYAAAIGLHYVAICAWRRQWPHKGLLTILIVAPLSSLTLNFLIMAAGYGWDYQKIIDLYKWRESKGEKEEFLWGEWLVKFWEHSLTNFTLPVLVATIGYLLLLVPAKIVQWAAGVKDTAGQIVRRFPHLWLFLLPGVLQLLILRGCLWEHQTWLLPLGPFIAMTAALGLFVAAGLLKKLHAKLAPAAIVILVGIIAIASIKGLNYYHSVRWQSEVTINLFRELNRLIPPEKQLLSFKDFVIQQHPSKGAFYRPEYAWYLDRDIVSARTVPEIEEKAKTGKFPYYLMPATNADQQYASYLAALSGELRKRYQARYIPADPFKPDYRQNVPCWIFDLRKSVGGKTR